MLEFWPITEPSLAQVRGDIVPEQATVSYISKCSTWVLARSLSEHAARASAVLALYIVWQPICGEGKTMLYLSRLGCAEDEAAFHVVGLFIDATLWASSCPVGDKALVGAKTHLPTEALPLSQRPLNKGWEQSNPAASQPAKGSAETCQEAWSVPDWPSRA